MKQFNFFLFFSLFCLLACEKADKNENLSLSLSDIIGTWEQVGENTINATNPVTMVTDIWRFKETYTFNPSGDFSISGQIEFKIGDTGKYFFNNNVISFECEGVYVGPNGSEIQLETEPQIWQWEINDLVADTLFVDIIKFDKITKLKNGIIFPRKYLKIQ